MVELADELGLLVSEEPGYWGMDFNKMPRSMVELGYRIMEKTIRRDWHSPSVFAWLLSNECHLTLEFLREGKEICNKLDPIGRLVSAANSMPKEKAKPIFEQAGMDFFDQHPYTFNVDDFNREAEFDGPSRPLTFTEWGGKAIGQSQMVMQSSVERLLDLLLWQGSELTIAGIPFRVPVVNGYVRPVLLAQEAPEVTVSVGQECERLHILGQVTFPVGYPVVGKRGEKVATYWYAPYFPACGWQPGVCCAARVPWGPISAACALVLGHPKPSPPWPTNWPEKLGSRVLKRGNQERGKVHFSQSHSTARGQHCRARIACNQKPRRLELQHRES